MSSNSGIRHRTAARQTARARTLRGNQTEAERKLWHALRAGRLNGWKFRRQAPVGRSIADFLCPQGCLIVELDGSQHIDDAKADAIRTAFLESQGYRVIRFFNNDVFGNFEGVLLAIAGALPRDHPLRNPSPLQGEGL